MAVRRSLTWRPKVAPVVAGSSQFPLAVSGNSRYLQTASGTPRLLNIASMWAGIQAISYADFTAFVDIHVARGVNCLHIGATFDDTSRFPSDSGNHFGAPNWKTPGGTSVPPFTTPGDFSTLNPTYVTHMLACLDYCASVGVTAILQACYIGAFGDNGEGWGSEMSADTNAHLTTYGAALATALAGRSNIIMGMGGDYHPASGSTLDQRMKAVVDGFRSVDTTRQWIGHWGGDPFADGSYGVLGGDLGTDNSTFASGYDMMRSHYAYNQGGKRARRRIRDGYGQSPTLPTLVVDTGYDGDGPTGNNLAIRSRTHATMCEGSCSMMHAVGGGSPDGWVYLVNQNATTATTEHGYAWQFWSALPWYWMAPDAGVFVTSGRGTDGNTVDDYVSVLAYTGCLVAHFPSGASRKITVDMTQFTGAGWFSGTGVRRVRLCDPTVAPASAYTTLAASVSTTGTITIGNTASPTYSIGGSNSAGDSDWLVVID